MSGPIVARVFVYGTLLSGEGNHRLLKHADFAGEARTLPRYLFVSLGGFPGLLEHATAAQAIVGELYDVDADTLRALDRLEGHPTFYKRTPITLADGTEAETYILSERYEHHERIPSGSWREHTRAQDEHHVA